MYPDAKALHRSTFQGEGLRLNLKACRSQRRANGFTRSGDHGHRDAGQETCIEVPSARNVSEGLQELNQVGFLRGCEIQGEQLIVVIDHRQKIRRTAIVEIWRMLPEPA